jgi:hypothetical protein
MKAAVMDRAYRFPPRPFAGYALTASADFASATTS